MGEEVDWKILFVSALLHDMGNIVRFNFDSNTEIYGSEASKLDYWKQMKQEMIDKYGADDHEATRSMLRELDVDPKIVDTILSKSFANAEAIRHTGTWLDKILLYADMRVLPDRIGTLKERLDELRSRRTDLLNNPSIENRFKACEDLEIQIQKHLATPVSAITNDSVISIEISTESIEV